VVPLLKGIGTRMAAERLFFGPSRYLFAFFRQYLMETSFATAENRLCHD
jgi:hypothetical protein